MTAWRNAENGIATTQLISVRDKSFPSWSWRMDEARFVAAGPTLSSFSTPLLTLDASAMRHNVDLMAAWALEHGFCLAPHGKTTMAPTLWRQLLDAGAWGLTFATVWQAQVARESGVSRVMLAGEVVDPVALEWVAAALRDPGFEFLCWVDSTESVELLASSLREHGAGRPLPVLVELGGRGGRAGARGVAAALAVAATVERTPELQLVGVAGWEGSVAHDRTPAGLDRVRGLLDELVELAEVVRWEQQPIVTAGGSAYFDIVGEHLARLRGHATLVLRAGAYQVHDEGFYRGISPLARRLRPAMHGWSRIVSMQDDAVAVLDGGRRDFPYDEGMPWTPVGPVVRMNDQHSYVQLGTPDVVVGERLRLGLSHPCTAFDKWRCIPVLADVKSPDPAVTGYVRTLF